MKSTPERLVDTLLQPLRIPPGWLVEYNLFTEFDPTTESMEYFWGSVMFAASDATRRVGIELIYEPEGDPNGEYVLELFRVITTRDADGSYVTENIHQIRTRLRLEVVEAIERFMVYRK